MDFGLWYGSSRTVASGRDQHHSKENKMEQSSFSNGGQVENKRSRENKSFINSVSSTLMTHFLQLQPPASALKKSFNKGGCEHTVYSSHDIHFLDWGRVHKVFRIAALSIFHLTVCCLHLYFKIFRRWPAGISYYTQTGPVKAEKKSYFKLLYGTSQVGESRDNTQRKVFA